MGNNKRKPGDEFGKVPPQNIELEGAVLGALLVEQNAYLRISKDLSPELFYKETNQIILNAIIQITEGGGKVDILTVCQFLKKHGLLDECGGAHYVAGLSANIGSAAHLEHHVLLLKELYYKRFIIREASELLVSAYNEETDAFDLVDGFEINLSKINDTIIVKDFTTPEQLMIELNERNIYITNNKGVITGIPSGFSELDKITAGWHGGHLNIIAARPGMGKTSFMLSMVEHQASLDIPVGIFSLEMTALELFTIIVSQKTRIPRDIFTKKGYIGEHQEIVSRVTDRIMKMPIQIDDTGGISFFQLKQKARRMVKQFGVKIIYIDYLQLIKIELQKGANREQEVATITKGLKALAKELNVPIILLAQLNRDVEKRPDKIPQVSDLRESGSIEQDADSVLFPWRGDPYGITEYENVDIRGKGILFMGKNRHGALEDIMLNWQGDISLFYDPTPQPF